ncbi:HAD family phosphatase [Ferrimicrobium sp.]|uniref:HAD family hydrolase n=1 Tax=Ferrimicrobium sp. TaxID=2926050 RepID=UPI0026038CC6|nr:HAD family phosphatase [Ferrimicrobium sp.]
MRAHQNPAQKWARTASLGEMAAKPKPGRTSPNVPVSAIVFDLGGVFIDWDPRHLYRKLFTNEVDMERFLQQVCTPEWHAQLDRGVPFSIAASPLLAANSELGSLVRAYHDRFREMWGSVSVPLVTLLNQCNEAGIPTYAATNWPGEYWDEAVATFPFLQTFDGILVSGLIGLIKPSIEFFEALTDSFGLNPGQTIFIDDRADNVRAAATAGYRSHRYVGAEALLLFLADNGIIFLDTP